MTFVSDDALSHTDFLHDVALLVVLEVSLVAIIIIFPKYNLQNQLSVLVLLGNQKVSDSNQ